MTDSKPGIEITAVLGAPWIVRDVTDGREKVAIMVSLKDVKSPVVLAMRDDVLHHLVHALETGHLPT